MKDAKLLAEFVRCVAKTDEDVRATEEMSLCCSRIVAIHYLSSTHCAIQQGAEAERVVLERSYVIHFVFL